MIPTVVVNVPQPIGTVACFVVIVVALAHLGLSVWSTHVWITEYEPAVLADEPDTDEMPTVIAHPASSEARKAELLRPVPYPRQTGTLRYAEGGHIDKPTTPPHLTRCIYETDEWRQQFRFSENGRRHG